MEWFFDGLGTELISIIIGVILGGGDRRNNWL